MFGLRSVKSVKEAFSSAPVLALPDYSKDLEVICDASGFAIGVLLQEGKPVAFESRSMADSERNYSAGDQELLAVIHALRTWRCYLQDIRPFTVVTDHSPNVAMPTKELFRRRQVAWSQFLQCFNFKGVYRPGRINVADPLSRQHSLLSIKVTSLGTVTTDLSGHLRASLQLSHYSIPLVASSQLSSLDIQRTDGLQRLKLAIWEQKLLMHSIGMAVP